MSDDSCIKCTKVVRPRQEAIQCEKCSGWQHRTCNTGITRDQYREAVRESTQIEWVCQDCTEASETAYNQKDSVYTFLRQLIALPFLPPEHITDTFLQLDARAPQAIVPVMNYVYSTWILVGSAVVYII